jgi:peptide/nickel transport system substrate-binding protein
MNLTRFRWAGGLALLALTTSACGMGGGGSAGAGAGGGDGNGHVVYAEFYPPTSAWALSSDDALTLSRAGCLETLVEYTSDGELVEMLATSWEQVEPTVWEFQLREGVKFQDGTPMDADAVAGALTHLLESKTPARSFNPEVVAGVDVVDESTIRIATKKPDVLLASRLATPSTGILAPKAYEAKQMDIQGTCTGPFEVVEEVPQQSLSIERNEDYWDGTPALATAEIRYIVDGAVRATQLSTGEVDIAYALPVVSMAELEGNDGVELLTVEMPRTSAMMLNNSRPPFDNPLVRQAIQRAIDTEAIANGVYEGVMTPATGPFSPEQPWVPEGVSPVTQDLDEAKRLFDEAGVDPSTLSFELIAYVSRPEFADVAAVIQDQLAQLGIEVKIKSGEWASFEPDLLAGNFDATLLSRGYLNDLGDPGGYLEADYSCKGSFNLTQFCDEKTEEQIAQAQQDEDQEARYQVYGEVAERLQSEANNVFLVHESAVVGTTTRVTNYEQHPLNFYVFTKELSVG